MHHRVTRLVLPMAAVAMVTAAGSAAGAGAAPAAPRTTPCPADVRAPVSVIPGASPSAGENAPSLRLALTARGTRAAGSDLVEYRVTARPARTPLHDITVTARLTCVPGDALLAGRPSASTGRATAGPRAVTWRFDLGKAPATAELRGPRPPERTRRPAGRRDRRHRPGLQLPRAPRRRHADRRLLPRQRSSSLTSSRPGLRPNARAPRPAAPPAARPAPVPAAPLAVHPAVPPIVSPRRPGPAGGAARKGTRRTGSTGSRRAARRAAGPDRCRASARARARACCPSSTGRRSCRPARPYPTPPPRQPTRQAP